jgi:hypothetical protein
MRYAKVATGNSYAHIPLNVNEPDLSPWTEPTLSILQAAYDKAVADGTLEIIEEVIEPPSLVDWQGFLNACDVPALGGNGVFQALVAINYAIAMDAYQLILRLNDGQGSTLEIRTLNFLYAMVVPGLSSELTEALQEALTEFNIPIQI